METIIQPAVEKTLQSKSSHENNMDFHIICNDRKNPYGASSFDLKPIDVKNMINKGVRVYASPHIGNHWTSNTFYREMGVIICDFTGNQSIYDTCDEPEKIILNGKKTFVATSKKPKLSPYLQMSKNQKGILSQIPELQDLNNLAGIHHKSKKKALGKNNVILDTVFLDFPYFKEIIKVLLTNKSSLLKEPNSCFFNRKVSKEGFVRKETSTEDIDIIIEKFIESKKQHERNVLNDNCYLSEGLLPIVEVWIFMDAIYSWLSHKTINNGVGDSFCVSGVDMIFYLKNPHKRILLNSMYKLIRDRIPELNLPEQMRFYIIPGGLFNFYPSKEELNLYEKVSSILSIREEQKNISQCFSLENLNRENLINSSKKLNTKMYNAKKDFQDIFKNRIPYTQYDILINNLSFCSQVNNYLMNLSFQEIKKLFH